MKKLVFVIILIVISTLNATASIKEWEKPTNNWWGKSSSSLRSAQIFDQSSYDSIALPYTVTNMDFDTLTTASMEILPGFSNRLPVICYKFTLLQKNCIYLEFDSDSISQFAFSISTNEDQTSPFYLYGGVGYTDSLEAGVYYIALLTNNQYGTFDLSITISVNPLNYQPISFPLDSINMYFHGGGPGTKFVQINGSGIFTGVGFVFTLPNDTILSSHFESSTIDQFTYSITSRNDSLFSTDFYHPELPDTLTAGTYYITIITAWKSGYYNLYLREGLYNTLSFIPITLPYTAVNELFNDTTVQIQSFELGYEADRMRAYRITLPTDTAIVIHFNSMDFPYFDLLFSDSTNFSNVIYNLSDTMYYNMTDSLVTATLTAGDYYLLLYTYSKFGYYDLSVDFKETFTTHSKQTKIDAEILTHENSIIVKGMQLSSSISIYDLQGNTLHSKLSNADIETFNIPVPGIYIVNINGQCKKVIVK